jgi:hypothetical protein
MKTKQKRKLRYGTIKAKINTFYFYRISRSGRSVPIDGVLGIQVLCELIDITNNKFKIRDVRSGRVLPRLRKEGELLTAGNKIVQVRKQQSK